MTASTQTRNDSYYALEDELGHRQFQVYTYLRLYGPLPNRLLAEGLGLPVQSVTGRVKELRQRGLVVEAGRVYDALTERHVIAWEAKPEKAPVETQERLL